MIWDSLIPQKVRFPYRKKLQYWQDFRAKQGVFPPDTVFDAEIIRCDRVTLRGLGYGMRPEYGNGAITLKCEDVVIYGKEVAP